QPKPAHVCPPSKLRETRMTVPPPPTSVCDTTTMLFGFVGLIATCGSISFPAARVASTFAAARSTEARAFFAGVATDDAFTAWGVDDAFDDDDADDEVVGAHDTDKSRRSSSRSKIAARLWL